ncbi:MULTISPECIES: hypothetical protein [Acinetobacter]|nr:MULTISPECIES: hypothetical protein [Acinetobacter]NHB64728.1 hypothetical protein [Acinetobacter sp. GFQ9D191M]NHB99198.1 hypothetical protein [Acinetobacter sp. GFQ9D192M]UNW07825.1 hypothetical protein MOV98_07170 [Acinetobacter variabilis]
MYPWVQLQKAEKWQKIFKLQVFSHKCRDLMKEKTEQKTRDSGFIDQK